MYFPLEINEQLANTMRMAAEFKTEVEKIIEITCLDVPALIDKQEVYKKMSDDICDMICTIGENIGLCLAEIALDEVRKLNPVNNESHVSK